MHSEPYLITLSTTGYDTIQCHGNFTVRTKLLGPFKPAATNCHKGKLSGMTALASTIKILLQNGREMSDTKGKVHSKSVCFQLKRDSTRDPLYENINLPYPLRDL